jgi:hypothetical protein
VDRRQLLQPEAYARQYNRAACRAVSILISAAGCAAMAVDFVNLEPGYRTRPSFALKP